MSPVRDRAVALAGVYLAVSEVRRVGREGNAGSTSLEVALASVFALNPPSVSAVYGGLAPLQTGLFALRKVLDHGRDRTSLEVSRYAAQLIDLERRVARAPGAMDHIRSDLEAMVARGLSQAPSTPSTVERLAQIYLQRVSGVGPRIMVNGEPEFLNAPGNPEKIRALLLAGLRSVVLWRQVGGNRLNLLLGRRALLRAVGDLIQAAEQPTRSEA